MSSFAFASDGQSFADFTASARFEATSGPLTVLLLSSRRDFTQYFTDRHAAMTTELARVAEGDAVSLLFEENVGAMAARYARLGPPMGSQDIFCSSARPPDSDNRSVPPFNKLHAQFAPLDLSGVRMLALLDIPGPAADPEWNDFFAEFVDVVIVLMRSLGERAALDELSKLLCHSPAITVAALIGDVDGTGAPEQPSEPSQSRRALSLALPASADLACVLARLSSPLDDDLVSHRFCKILEQAKCVLQTEHKRIRSIISARERYLAWMRASLTEVSLGEEVEAVRQGIRTGLDAILSKIEADLSPHTNGITIEGLTLDEGDLLEWREDSEEASPSSTPADVWRISLLGQKFYISVRAQSCRNMEVKIRKALRTQSEEGALRIDRELKALEAAIECQLPLTTASGQPVPKLALSRPKPYIRPAEKIELKNDAEEKLERPGIFGLILHAQGSVTRAVSFIMIGVVPVASAMAWPVTRNKLGLPILGGVVLYSIYRIRNAPAEERKQAESIRMKLLTMLGQYVVTLLQKVRDERNERARSAVREIKEELNAYFERVLELTPQAGRDGSGNSVSGAQHRDSQILDELRRRQTRLRQLEQQVSDGLNAVRQRAMDACRKLKASFPSKSAQSAWQGTTSAAAGADAGTVMRAALRVSGHSGAGHTFSPETSSDDDTGVGAGRVLDGPGLPSAAQPSRGMPRGAEQRAVTFPDRGAIRLGTRSTDGEMSS